MSYISSVSDYQRRRRTSLLLPAGFHYQLLTLEASLGKYQAVALGLLLLQRVLSSSLLGLSALLKGLFAFS